jgi:hypothetical protein
MLRGVPLCEHVGCRNQVINNVGWKLVVPKTWAACSLDFLLNSHIIKTAAVLLPLPSLGVSSLDLGRWHCFRPFFYAETKTPHCVKFVTGCDNIAQF